MQTISVIVCAVPAEWACRHRVKTNNGVPVLEDCPFLSMQGRGPAALGSKVTVSEEGLAGLKRTYSDLQREADESSQSAGQRCDP